MSQPTLLAADESALHFRRPTQSVARVLHQIRTVPAATRSMLCTTLDISQPSITRHVRALINAGLAEEREIEHDGTRPGRPRLILGLDGRHVTTWGVHMGLRTTTVTVSDGAGRLLRERDVPLSVAECDPQDALDQAATLMRELGRGLPAPATVGAAFSTHLDRAGVISSEEYGWHNVHVARELSTRLGQPVHVSAGVAAMAAQELLGNPFLGADDGSSTLYFYAREVVNQAWIVNGAVHRPHSGLASSSFLHLAFGGRLDTGHGHPLGNSSVVHAARTIGVPAQSFSDLVRCAAEHPGARELLDERAALLADAISLVLEVVDPETLVLAGEAFTRDEAGLRTVVRTIRERRGGPEQLGINLAGPAVTRDAARLVGLYPFWCDPLGHLG